MKSFAKFTKDRITTLGKNQKDLASILRVSPAYISQIITGKKNPPDLSKPKNKVQLRLWCDFLETPEEDILGMVRHELHGAPPPPKPRYKNLRNFLLGRIPGSEKNLVDEMKSLELHPAESMALNWMVQAYMILQEETDYGNAFGAARFREFCSRAKSNKEFVEKDLVDFFKDQDFSWSWDREQNRVRVNPISAALNDAVGRLDIAVPGEDAVIYPKRVPIVGHVSAGEGFEFTDGGFEAGEGFDFVDMPPGIDPALSESLYCVRVRGDSLREFFGAGALLFIKPQSWEEIKDGDLVIFKDRVTMKAYVKKIEFSGESLILKSMNPLYKNMVLTKADLILLERVMAILL